MSCRTSSYFSSIESAIAVSPAPFDAVALEARHLPREARSSPRGARPARSPLAPASVFWISAMRAFERLPPQLAHAVLGREAPPSGTPSTAISRHQPPRVLVEPGEDRRQRHALVAPGQPPAPRAGAAPTRRPSRSGVLQLVERVLDARRPLRHERRAATARPAAGAAGGAARRRAAASAHGRRGRPVPARERPAQLLAGGRRVEAARARRSRGSQAARSTALSIRTSAGSSAVEVRGLAGGASRVSCSAAARRISHSMASGASSRRLR